MGHMWVCQQLSVAHGVGKEPSVARLRVSFFKSVTITAASVRADLTPDTLPRKSIGRLVHFPLVLWDFSFPSGL